MARPYYSLMFGGPGRLTKDPGRLTKGPGRLTQGPGRFTHSPVSHASRKACDCFEG